jgi:ADP-ribosylglycohydrolase
VEFISRATILNQFGPAGIRDYAPAFGRKGVITDDTQMTLFTAEGFIRAAVRYANRGICNPTSVIHRAYLRWLQTQSYAPQMEVEMDGWLAGLQSLHTQRAPGNTCIEALRTATQLGNAAQNESKGCGTVMRIAPIGLACQESMAFQMAVDTAALTHGHPTALASTGFLSTLYSGLTRGEPLPDAIARGLEELRRYPGHEESLLAIEQAVSLAGNRTPDSGAVEKLGGGWVAEEAVAIALYCVMACKSFEDAVLLAVNHSGDSDSTGSIAGNLWGVIHGVNAIPGKWLDGLELRDEIMALADDLLGVSQETLDLESTETWNRYPGY